MEFDLNEMFSAWNQWFLFVFIVFTVYFIFGYACHFDVPARNPGIRGAKIWPDPD